MKVYSVTSTFTFLTLLFLFAVNDKSRGLRGPDTLVDSLEENVVGNRRTLLVTKSAVDAKLGTALTQKYQDFLLTSRDTSGPQEDEYIAVDITFKNILDSQSAKAALLPAVEVDIIECYKYICSTRVPVRALQDVSNIEAVQSVRKVEAITQGGSVTTEGDFAMYADIARNVHRVNGNGLLIGVLSDSFN